MNRYGMWGGVGMLVWVCLAFGAGPVGAQAITEAWVAEQLGRARRAQPPATDRGAASSLPTLSLSIRYQPETGALTPASIRALYPLYDAVNTFVSTPFHIVCCDGLPAAEAPRLTQQLVAQLSRLFTDRGGGNHVQFDAQVSPAARLPQIRQAHTARVNVYRLP